jgi:hypothetical protein
VLRHIDCGCNQDQCTLLLLHCCFPADAVAGETQAELYTCCCAYAVASVSPPCSCCLSSFSFSRMLPTLRALEPRGPLLDWHTRTAASYRFESCSHRNSSSRFTGNAQVSRRCIPQQRQRETLYNVAPAEKGAQWARGEHAYHPPAPAVADRGRPMLKLGTGQLHCRAAVVSGVLFTCSHLSM